MSSIAISRYAIDRLSPTLIWVSHRFSGVIHCRHTSLVVQLTFHVHHCIIYIFSDWRQSVRGPIIVMMKDDIEDDQQVPAAGTNMKRLQTISDFGLSINAIVGLTFRRRPPSVQAYYQSWYRLSLELSKDYYNYDRIRHTVLLA